jgi:hypothetical protein
MICPVCDFDSADALSILGHIDDLSLLVTLTCDFADRIADKPFDPQATKERLLAARNWKENPQAMLEADKVAWASGVSVGNAVKVAKCALMFSKARSAPKKEALLVSARELAQEAAQVTAQCFTNYNAECRRQAKHARALACTCADRRKVFGSRLRNSLLAA